ncbi:MAG: hypothetical protein JW983_06065 [Elusimicrobia bacterium]|nr:hypothetical protein [Elusimicrobiota bacterium]
MQTILKHIFPICLTALFILGAWIIITLPVAGVCLMDGEPVISSYIKFVMYAISVSFAISAVIMFPMALLAERFTKRKKALVILIPVCLFAISSVLLIGWFLFTKSFFNTMSGWPGGLFAFSLVFCVYWSLLWLGQAVINGLKRLTHKIAA